MNAAAAAAAMPRRPSLIVLAAFAAIYLIWGSTYLGILIAIETIPPFVMVGVRYIVAGLLLYGWVAWRGEATRPTLRHWRSAFFYGTLFFLGGNGGVTWAETRIPSGVAAVMVGIIPLSVALIEWKSRRGVRPSAMAWAGILLGFAGVVVLIGPSLSLTKSAVDPIGALALLIGVFGWSYALVHSKSASRPPSILQTVAMQMLGGGLIVLVVSTLTGEWSGFRIEAVSLRSHLAFWYLVFFGSIVAFSAFTYLIKVTSPAAVATYAFVNPIVAVFLGWLLAGEPVTPRTLVATAAVVGGVILILRSRAREHAVAPAVGAKEPA